MPKHFAMPSLMADLGVIEPRFNVLIAAVVIGMALVAIALGTAPTAWRLHRRAARSTAIAPAADARPHGARLHERPIIGLVLGGWLTEDYSWRWVFYINVPIGILTFLG
jgi:hypothetical protein